MFGFFLDDYFLFLVVVVMMFGNFDDFGAVNRSDFVRNVDSMMYTVKRRLINYLTFNGYVY